MTGGFLAARVLQAFQVSRGWIHDFKWFRGVGASRQCANKTCHHRGWVGRVWLFYVVLLSAFRSI